jgi:fructokinase
VTDDAPLIAGVELGGTKGVAILARGRTILRRTRVPTTGPGETLTALSDAIAGWALEIGPPAAIGIASFGPLGLDSRRRDFGLITRTTKPRWSNTDVLGHFRAAFDGPVGFDTDVAGAGLAESRWGAGRGRRVVIYVTVGTGIGGGVIVDGRPVHGRIHPEIGHLRVRRAPGDGFPGVCAFHGDCLEGLASGPAIAARAGAPAETLAQDHPAWAFAADALAEMCASLLLTLSPDLILIGGGVPMGKPFLFPMVRAATLARMGGYVAGLTERVLSRIVRPPALGEKAGPLGAIALGLEALRHPATRD